MTIQINITFICDSGWQELIMSFSLKKKTAKNGVLKHKPKIALYLVRFQPGSHSCTKLLLPPGHGGKPDDTDEDLFFIGCFSE